MVSVLILFIPVDAPVKENVNSEDSLIQKCNQKNYKNTDFLVVRNIQKFLDERHRRWKLTAMDSDGDGTDNKTDTDDDNDGVLDTADALPLDPNSSTDNNNDGRADEDE